MPVMHLVAGPHGAGKTTLYEYLIAPRHPALPFVNPSAGTAAKAAQQREWADAERASLLQAGRSFVTETTFAHASRLSLITHARSLGYEVVLYAMGVDDPAPLLARVAQRVREGGAPVPSHKVLERYARCMDNFRRAVRIADLAFLLDAIDVSEGGPRLVASVAAGQMQLHQLARPRWVERVLGFAEA